MLTQSERLVVPVRLSDDGPLSMRAGAEAAGLAVGAVLLLLLLLLLLSWPPAAGDAFVEAGQHLPMESFVARNVRLSETSQRSQDQSP